MSKKKILVSIVNYGTEQLECLEKMVWELMYFQNYDVTVNIITNHVGTDDSQGLYDLALFRSSHSRTDIIALALNDNQLYPLMARENIAKAYHYDFDLYIYSENDHLITEANIIAWEKAQEALPDNYVAGWLQIEKYPEGKFYPAYHPRPDGFGFDKNSVEQFGEYTVAEFANKHQASFILTRDQLRHCLSQGNKFFELSNNTQYSKKCRANTDIFTEFGLKRVIPISHLSEFEIWHMPNKYKGKLGNFEQKLRAEIAPLLKKDTMNRTEIINKLIAKNGYKKYLEIGVRDENDNYAHIKCEVKHGVDPNKGGNYRMTSDQFFNDKIGAGRKYDLIFIDGLHTAEQVEKDIRNALRHISENGTILVHDTNPKERWLTRSYDEYLKERGDWTGDGYKAIIGLKAYKGIKFNTVDVETGITIIQAGTAKGSKVPANVDYDYLEKNRTKALKLITEAAFAKKYL